MIKKGEHLTEEGLLKIISFSLKSALNLGLPNNLSEAFPTIEALEPLAKREYVFKGIPDPFWIYCRRWFF